MSNVNGFTHLPDDVASALAAYEENCKDGTIVPWDPDVPEKAQTDDPWLHDWMTSHLSVIDEP